jgi:hypothetical protein
LDELKAYDIVVVEPAHGTIRNGCRAGTQVVRVRVRRRSRIRPAYVKDSARRRAGANAPWRAHVIDQTTRNGRAFFVERIVAPLWDAGYRGFFSTRSIPFSSSPRPMKNARGQVKGLAGASAALRKQYPEAKLIFNRGFEVLPELHAEAYAVAWSRSTAAGTRRTALRRGLPERPRLAHAAAHAHLEGIQAAGHRDRVRAAR